MAMKILEVSWRDRMYPAAGVSRHRVPKRREKYEIAVMIEYSHSRKITEVIEPGVGPPVLSEYRTDNDNRSASPVEKGGDVRNSRGSRLGNKDKGSVIIPG
jgi:hypothetical protein